MVVEGVNFIDKAVRRLTKAEFVRMHEDVFFLDRKKEERRRMLANIYSRIVKG